MSSHYVTDERVVASWTLQTVLLLALSASSLVIHIGHAGHEAPKLVFVI